MLNLNNITPPEIFVSQNNYPKVKAGVLSSNNMHLLNTPESWYKNKLNISQIINQRKSMIYSNFNAHVRFENKFKDILQEISLASKKIDVEVELKKYPMKKIAYDSVIAPLCNPAPLNNINLTSNVKIDKKIDYLYEDYDVKSKDAILELYKHKKSISQINRILSAGCLGLKKK